MCDIGCECVGVWVCGCVGVGVVLLSESDDYAGVIRWERVTTAVILSFLFQKDTERKKYRTEGGKKKK